MGIFGKRHDDTPSSSPAARPGVGEDDFKRCSALLLSLDSALASGDGSRINAAGYALALAGGYPSLRGRALYVERVTTDIQAGRPGAGLVDRRPWQWLAAVAAAAWEGASAAYEKGDTAGERDKAMLAGRLGFASLSWRLWCSTQIERIAPRCTVNPDSWPIELNTQFAEDVGLFPPPDDCYAVILASAVKALGSLEADDLTRLVISNDAEKAWTAEEVLPVVAQFYLQLVGLDENGIAADPVAFTYAAGAVAAALRQQESTSDKAL